MITLKCYLLYSWGVYLDGITIQILLNNIQKLKHWQPNLKNLKLKLCTWNKQITIWKRNLIFDQCALHKIQGLVLCHIHKSGMIYRSMLSVETISRHSVDILTQLSSADTILDILANSYRSSVGISIHALGLEYLFTNIPTRLNTLDCYT